MDTLQLLQALTLAVRLLLAGALAYVVLRRGEALPRHGRAAWRVVAVVFVVVAVDYALIEGLAILRNQGVHPELFGALRRRLYHPIYLLHGLLLAALPALLVAVAGAGVLRRAALGLAGACLAVAVAGSLRGALVDWDTLLTWTRPLSFLGIAAYLGFGALVLLGRLPRVDAYLAGFIAIRLVFELVIPIQEAFFQAVGYEEADSLWTLLQFLQLVTASAQLAVVGALTNALARGRTVSPVVLQA